MAAPSPKLVFVLFFLINVILFTQNLNSEVSASSHDSLTKRFAQQLSGTPNPLEALEKQCRPNRFPVADQCSHVQHQCKKSDTFIGVQYVSSFFCTDHSLRPLAFFGLLIWLLFLFSTLGISASDFFTPNLGTIATLLGLDESVAGVTFLAFGNGSPDVFSTFSAMRAQSGSLAIGELLGAASFIVSCVVGSMCIIHPFAVKPKPFLRDVGFFTLAVSFLFASLWDSEIALWEAICLLTLYIVYVVVVVVGSWWDRRAERIRLADELERSEYRDDESSGTFSTPYQDEPNTHSLHLQIPNNERGRAYSNPHPTSSPTAIRPRAWSYSAHPDHTMPSFSLVGALEFRHVVSSLRQDAAGNSLMAFEHAVSPFAGGHYHATRPRSRPRTPHAHVHETNPFDEDMGVQLNDRLLRPMASNATFATTLATTPEERSPRSPPPRSPEIDTSPLSPRSYTQIDHYDGQPSSAGDSEAIDETESQLSLPPPPPPSRRRKFMHILWRTLHILFPSLYDFRDKSLLGQIASLFAAPAIMALTLTLPVAVTPYDNDSASQEKAQQDASGRLIEFEEEGEARALIAEEEEDQNEMRFNKWLMGVQCALGPLFCATVLTAGTAYQMWAMISVAIVGTVVGILVFIFAKKGNHPASVMARCFMGFIVAIVWIMAIADEVVQVLQTFGLIFGLSDALIGLTIFAVGNSLADLVANMSVAVFAPAMGFSACFGGPMLNILLGVGGSSVYVITHRHASHYDLEFTTTLLVSSIGLLFLLATTIIVVPWNGYHLTRRWGIFLICSYLVIMTMNVVVELQT